MSEPTQLGVYEFDRYRLDIVERTLWRADQRVALGGRAFEVLAALVRRAGKLVTKEELFRVAWQGRVVEEGNLHVQISALRKILGPEAITTVARYGYRLELEASPRSQTGEELSFQRDLPTPVTPLVTRPKEEAGLAKRLAQSRLVTLKGMGGIGKTRLAIEACRQFGVKNHGLRTWFLEASSLSNNDMNQAKSTHSPTNTRVTDTSKKTTSLLTHLREQPTVLLVDGCELYRSTVGWFARLALETCPELKIVCTSRQPLGLIGESIYEVPHLDNQLSKQLFLAHAPNFFNTDALDLQNDRLFDEILKRLDGIPLALELAAARLQVISLTDLEQQLVRQLEVLTASDVSVPARQQTLRATVDWSYKLLSDQEKRLLNFLCTFQSWFTPDAAYALVANDSNDSTDVRNVLSDLADKSLVEVIRGTEINHYRISNSIREYGQESLRITGDYPAAKRQHLSYLTSVLQNSVKYQHTLKWREKYLPALEHKRSDFEAALEWAFYGSDSPGSTSEPDGGGHLVADLIYFWVDSGRLDDAARWLTRALDKVQSTEARSLVVHALGCALAESGKFAEAITKFRAALEGFKSLDGQELNIAITENELGISLFGLQQLQAARISFESALAIFTKLQINFKRGQLIQNLAVLEFAEGEIEACETRLEEALVMLRADESVRSESTALMWLAECEYLKGQFSSALELITLAKSYQPASPTDLTSAIIFSRYARCAAAVGQITSAGRAVGVALPVLLDLGHKRALADCLECITVISMAIGNRERAARLLVAASKWRTEETLPRSLPWSRYFETIQDELQINVVPQASFSTATSASTVSHAIVLAKQVIEEAIASDCR